MVDHNLVTCFYQDISPSRPNEWEVEEAFERLELVNMDTRKLLLAQVPAIWPVSNALCFEFLKSGGSIVAQLPPGFLPEWVRQLLGVYEKSGLQGTREFMADVDGRFLAPLRGEAGVSFESLSVRLLHFARGLSGISLQLETAPVPVTDTEIIFLPPWIGVFPRRQDNEWLYKLILACQYAHIFRRVYSGTIDSPQTPPFASFREPGLAKDLFRIQRLYDAWRYLESELPGLATRTRSLGRKMVEALAECAEHGLARHRLLAELMSCLFAGAAKDDSVDTAIVANYANLLTQPLPELYEEVVKAEGAYSLEPVELLLGEFDFSRAAEKIEKVRAASKDKFSKLAALFLAADVRSESDSEHGNSAPSAVDQAVLVLQEGLGKKTAVQEKRQGAQEEANSFAIPDELRSVAQQILDDLGVIPESYFQAAVGLAGGGVNRQEGGLAVDEQVAAPEVAAWKYDEWDYRRGGYRHDWCTVYEKEINEVSSGFVLKTLSKYDAQLRRLKRQFEALRTRQRFVRRRRDGDEIDLDAVIDSLGDSRAGYSPSDRLFIKLLRDDRDITAMFLVDMSNSTEGWVGIALKETLVLLTEALEVAQDRYGIYGFSGMRRSRSELYCIKGPDEPYSKQVQRRIAGVMPMEYTRMGPAIRHICAKMRQEQSRIRILVVLSDGKPEDYDDYKGQYAIEDTRKALLEARGVGIFVFCITIDRTAHDYLEYMFGRGNYIFVADLVRLPEKMAEMYRLLTS